jgi:hypothetical protein
MSHNRLRGYSAAAVCGLLIGAFLLGRSSKSVNNGISGGNSPRNDDTNSIPPDMHAFVALWFHQLGNQRTNEAMLMTLHPLQRQVDNPLNDSEMELRFGQDQLPAFRNSEIARFFDRNGRSAEVHSLPLVSFTGEGAGFDSVRYNSSWFVKSAEGDFQVDLVVEKINAGGNRVRDEWQIVFSETKFVAKALTGYGIALRNLQAEAAWFGQRWIDRLVDKQLLEVYRDTLSAGERAAAKALPSAALLEDLSRRDFFKGRLPFFTEEQRHRLSRAWDFGLVLKADSFGVAAQETSPKIVITPKDVECVFPVEMAIPRDGGGFEVAAARVIVVSTSPTLLAKLEQLKKTAKPDQENEIQGSLSFLPARSWRIARVELNLEPLRRKDLPFVIGNENDDLLEKNQR